MPDAQTVALEVPRKGRRPRYHRGQLRRGTLVEPPACNMGQVVSEVRVHREPPSIRRPDTQVCRRCWPTLEVTW